MERSSKNPEKASSKTRTRTEAFKNIPDNWHVLTTKEKQFVKDMMKKHLIKLFKALKGFQKDLKILDRKTRKTILFSWKNSSIDISNLNIYSNNNTQSVSFLDFLKIFARNEESIKKKFKSLRK